MAELVYLLCFLTSLACAALLLRGYKRTRSRLLLWSGLCFAMFTVNNALLFIDLVIYPEHDLSVIRNLSGFLAVALLVFGLVWEAE